MPLDPTTLLCEHCGYIIEGLPAGGNCPECGTPTRASLPESRQGSPWQERRGLIPFLRTNWLAIRHPAALFSSVRLDVRSGASLLSVNLFIAAIAILAPWSGVLLDDPIRTLRSAHAPAFLRTALLAIPGQILVIAAALLGLTLLEWAGIQFFARRRGARLCSVAAWQVVAHASVGWVAAAALVVLALALDPWIPSLAIGTPLGTADTAVLVPLCGAIVGLLIFESLVAIGVHRCRFANRPRPIAA